LHTAFCQPDCWLFNGGWWGRQWFTNSIAIAYAGGSKSNPDTKAQSNADFFSKSNPDAQAQSNTESFAEPNADS
jgi:hypothetical protein